MRRIKALGLLFGALACVAGCACEGDLYYCAVGPSPTADQPTVTDRAETGDASDERRDEDHPDVSPMVDADDVLDVVTDQPMMADQLVDEDAITVDGPDVTTDVSVDVDVADASDGAVDVADHLDASEVGMPDADVPDGPMGTDVLDASEAGPVDTMSATDAIDGSDDRPDGSTDVDDVVIIMDVADVADHPDADDAGSTDAADMADAAEVVDVPLPPDLVIDYVTSRGEVVIPSDQDASRIDYSFGGGTRTVCATVRTGGSGWRCTVPMTPSSARSATYLYLTIPNACGIGLPTRCDGWLTLWSITLFGMVYTSDTMITTEAGREPALRLADRAECDTHMSYANTCVRVTIQR